MSSTELYGARGELDARGQRTAAFGGFFGTRVVVAA